MITGYITMPTKDFAKAMGLSLNTLRKYEKSLMEKGLLMKDKIRDDEGRMVTVRTVYIPETSTHPEDDQILAQVAEINKEKLDNKDEL